MSKTDKTETDLIRAFRGIVSIAIEIVGEDVKDDLILLGKSAGLTEEVLKEKFPVLYERSITEEDFAEEEDKENEENEEYDPTDDDNKLNEQDK